MSYVWFILIYVYLFVLSGDTGAKGLDFSLVILLICFISVCLFSRYNQMFTCHRWRWVPWTPRWGMMIIITLESLNSSLHFVRTIMWRHDVILLWPLTSGAPGAMGPSGHEGPKGQKGSQGRESSNYMKQVHCLVFLDWDILNECKMPDQVIMEWTDNLVSEVVKVQLGPEVSQDLQALDRRVTEVRITSTTGSLCLLVILTTSSSSWFCR